MVGVDAGSADASRDILVEALGEDRVIDAPEERGAGFGSAVATGLASGVLRADADEAFDIDTTEWIWLLHDDSAPAPDCLELLLAAADEYPRAAILGPKARGWHDRRLLLEVGFTVTGSGRRVTGLERREHDQGQHDGRSEVHAVGTAGMLVRRDAWEELGGFDPALPLYRDDLDLCWRAWRAGYEVRVVPGAVVHHREASYHGRREGSTEPVLGHRLDRRSALHVLLAQTPAWRLPFTLLRLVLGSLIRSLAYLVMKDLGRARDELLAIGSTLAHPGRLWRARRRVHATSRMSSRAAVGEFRPRAVAQVRAALETVGGALTSGRSPASGAVGALESGPVAEEADFFEDPAGGWVRRTLARPVVAVTLALLVLAVVAGRALWWGDGVLFGGALLPAPAGAADLWASYRDAWHDVGPGSTTPSPPWIALLAVVATVLLGKAQAAVAALFLLAVPAAALSAWWSLRGAVVSAAPRAWASITWALLPAVTGGIAGGFLGMMGAAILLPPTVRALVRALGLACPPLPPTSGRTAWWAALLIAVSTACLPLTWPLTVLAVIAALVWAWVLQRRADDPQVASALTPLLLRSAVVIIVPLVLLLPWSLHLLSNPSLLLAQPGLVDSRLAEPAASPLDLLLLQPGGPGSMPAWIGVAVVLAALLALLRRDRRPAVIAAWGVAVVALVLGIAMTVVRVSVPGVVEPQRLWPGAAALVMGGALVAAIGIAGDGLRQSLESANFDWLRTPIAYIAPWIAIVAPLLWALWFAVPGAGDPLRRGDPDVLPPFVVAEALGPQAPRTLLLRPRGGEGNASAGVDYTLVNGAGLQIGDADTAPPTEVWQPVDSLVSGLVSGRGGGEVAGLALYAVRYVVLERAASAESLVRTLDAAPGLRRLAGQEGEVLWRVDGDPVRLRQAETADPTAAEPIPVGDLSSADPLASAPLPLDGPGRVSLSQVADSRWLASAGDQPLSAQTSEEGLQEFDVPAGVAAGTAFTVQFDSAARSRWLAAQLIAVVVVVVLALPGRRRTTDDDIADENLDEDDVGVLAEDGIVVQGEPVAAGSDEGRVNS